ncbi:MAG: hypothetical protein ACE5R6_10270 [Candidatus Heimdallarchaeota archaeon]
MGKARKDRLKFVRWIIRYGGRIYTMLFVLILLVFILTWCGAYRQYVGGWEVLLVLVGGVVCVALDRRIRGVPWHWRGLPLGDHKGVIGLFDRRPKNRLLILFGLFIATGVVVHTVNIQPMGGWMRQWLFPWGLILLGVITAGVYLWQGSDTLFSKQTNQSGASPFGGIVSGVFLALGLSLCYHYRYLDDPYSLGWVLLLWGVLSGVVASQGPTRGDASDTDAPSTKECTAKPTTKGQSDGKAKLIVSLAVGLVVSVASHSQNGAQLTKPKAFPNYYSCGGHRSRFSQIS